MCITFDHRAPPAELRELKMRMMADAEISMDASGAFNFVVQMKFDDLSAYDEYQKSLADDIAKYAETFETSFICQQYTRGDLDSHMWVPTPYGKQRVNYTDIIKVKAERDYMRIHTKCTSWMYHSTFRELAHVLEPHGFLIIHRSTIVNCEHVQRLLHQGRQWAVLLTDGSTENVSKSHVNGTVRTFTEDHWSNGGGF